MSFGEMALIEGKPRSADAYAKRDVSLYSMNPEQLDQLREDRPIIATKILSNITRQLASRLRISGVEWLRRSDAEDVRKI